MFKDNGCLGAAGFSDTCGYVGRNLDLDSSNNRKPMARGSSNNNTVAHSSLADLMFFIESINKVRNFWGCGGGIVKKTPRNIYIS